jgi:hypothetical protein
VGPRAGGRAATGRAADQIGMVPAQLLPLVPFDQFNAMPVDELDGVLFEGLHAELVGPAETLDGVLDPNEAVLAAQGQLADALGEINGD